jgi:hypothetical protein
MSHYRTVFMIGKVNHGIRKLERQIIDANLEDRRTECDGDRQSARQLLKPHRAPARRKRGQVPKTGTAQGVLCIFGT